MGPSSCSAGSSTDRSSFRLLPVSTMTQSGVTHIPPAVMLFLDVFVAPPGSGHFGQGPLRGRKPDAGYRLFRKLAETFHRQHEMGAPLVVGDGVNLVENQGLDVLESPASALRGQQDVQGLGRGNEGCAGGVWPYAAAPTLGVSPVRTAVVICGSGVPNSSANALISDRGTARFF